MSISFDDIKNKVEKNKISKEINLTNKNIERKNNKTEKNNKNGIIFKFLDSKFGIDNGVDIYDDTSVLFRKNEVVKNIVFLTNIIYSIILFITSYATNNSFILSILFLPFTFALNSTIKKVMYSDRKSYINQRDAMILISISVLASSFIIYLRLALIGSYLKDIGYLLIFYSLLLISFYQQKQLTVTVSKIVLITLTIIHFTVTYSIYNKAYSSNFSRFVNEFFVSSEFKDIILRTIVLVIYLVGLYSLVFMGNYLQSQRKKESSNKDQITSEYIDVVYDVFMIIESSSHIFSNYSIIEIELITKISQLLSNKLNYSIENINEIIKFASLKEINKIKFDDFHDKTELNNKSYEQLKVLTKDCISYIKRIEICKIAEELIRSSIEGNLNLKKLAYLSNKKDQVSQIVLFSEFYTILRSNKTYKRPFSHEKTMQIITNELYITFDEEISDIIRTEEMFKTLMKINK